VALTGPRQVGKTTREWDFVAFAQRQNGVLIKPRRVVDPDDALAPERERSAEEGRSSNASGKVRHFQRRLLLWKLPRSQPPCRPVRRPASSQWRWSHLLGPFPES